MCLNYHYIAKCNIARCARDLRNYKKFSNQEDKLLKNLKELALQELKFFYKHRHNLQNVKTNGFGKYIAD